MPYAKTRSYLGDLGIYLTYFVNLLLLLLLHGIKSYSNTYIICDPIPDCDTTLCFYLRKWYRIRLDSVP